MRLCGAPKSGGEETNEECGDRRNNRNMQVQMSRTSRFNTATFVSTSVVRIDIDVEIPQKVSATSRTMAIPTTSGGSALCAH